MMIDVNNGGKGNIGNIRLGGGRRRIYTCLVLDWKAEDVPRSMPKRAEELKPTVLDLKVSSFYLCAHQPTMENRPCGSDHDSQTFHSGITYPPVKGGPGWDVICRSDHVRIARKEYLPTSSSIYLSHDLGRC